MDERIRQAVGTPRFLVTFLGCVFAVTIFFANAMTYADEEKAGEVESRGMPQVPMQPGTSVPPSAPAQQKFQLPTWPQKFDIEDQQPASFGFAVTQPGPLIVDVQSQGPPLDVTLRGPGPQPVMQRGQGNVRLTYQVTPQDVQRGILWVVRIALVPDVKGKGNGQVTVQYPPVNEAQAEAAVRMRIQQAKPQSQANPTQIQGQAQALLQARKNEIDRQYQEYIKGTALQLDTFLKEKGFQGQIQSRALQPPAPGSSSQIEPPRKDLKEFFPPPPPHIDRLSVTQGPPGTTVIIEGSGFTDGPGFVHMTLSPTQEVIAPLTGSPGIWGDGSIAVKVPELTGVVAFTANFFVSVGADRNSQLRSNSVPFNLIPRQQVRVVTTVTGDHRLADVDSHFPSFVSNNEIHHTRLNALNPLYPGWWWFIGVKGNDWFFEQTNMKNGWKFDCVEIIPYDFHHCLSSASTVYGASDWHGAYVVAGLGTASPQFAVHWWMEAFDPWMAYTYAFTISGPEGTPDGIAVP